MSTILVSLADSAEEESVTAAYYVMEDGWVTFKTDEGKLVASYPEKRIIRIKVEKSETSPKIQGTAVEFHTPHLPPASEEAARAIAAKWGSKNRSQLDKTDDMIREIDPTWTTGK